MNEQARELLLARLPQGHPRRMMLEAERDLENGVEVVVDAERAALRSAADAAKARAGTGSPPARLDDLEARVAALEAGA